MRLLNLNVSSTFFHWTVQDGHISFFLCHLGDTILPFWTWMSSPCLSLLLFGSTKCYVIWQAHGNLKSLHGKRKSKQGLEGDHWESNSGPLWLASSAILAPYIFTLWKTMGSATSVTDGMVLVEELFVDVVCGSQGLWYCNWPH